MTIGELKTAQSILLLDNGCEVQPGHDQFWIEGKPTAELTGFEIEELDLAGWFWDEDTESWSHY